MLETHQFSQHLGAWHDRNVPLAGGDDREMVRDERGEIRRHVKVFVNGEDATRSGGVETVVPSGARVHIVNAVSGG